MTIGRSVRNRVATALAHQTASVPRWAVPELHCPVVAVSVYRARNVRLVTEMIAALPSGSDVRLHALGEISTSLISQTINSGAGMRIPLLKTLLASRAVPHDAWVLLFDDDAQFVRSGSAKTKFLQYAAAGGLGVAAPAIQPGNPTSHEHAIARAMRTARRVGMVDSGPVVAFSPKAREHIDIFPDDVHGMGWGLDVRWALTAAEFGLPVGVIDATPIRHHGPVGADYETKDERAVLDAELEERGVDLMDLCRNVGDSWRPWQRRAPWLAP